MLTAPRIVRTERAVRPCLPITLPTSCGATRSFSTVLSSRSMDSTATAAGSSTSAWAISRSSSTTELRELVSFWVIARASDLNHREPAYIQGLGRLNPITQSRLPSAFVCRPVGGTGARAVFYRAFQHSAHWISRQVSEVEIRPRPELPLRDLPQPQLARPLALWSAR